MKKLYVIRDVLAGYGLTQPAIIDLPNDQIALRVLKGSCAAGAQANQFNTNPEDKEFWCIGEFDERTGRITPCDPYLVGKAIDFLEVNNNAKSD